MNEGGTMNAKVRAFGVMAGGALGATLGVVWFGSDPLAGLSVAVCGAAMLCWGGREPAGLRSVSVTD